MPTEPTAPAPLAPVPALPNRVPLQRTSSALVAVRATTQELIRVIGQAGPTLAQIGDWIILQETYPIAVVPPDRFPPPEYTIVAEGALVIPRPVCELIEQTTGVGTTRSPVELVAAIHRLARISIGEVNVPFTPGQIEELQHRARKRGQTIAQAIQAVVDRIRDELFWKGP